MSRLSYRVLKFLKTKTKPTALFSSSSSVYEISVIDLQGRDLVADGRGQCIVYSM